MATGDDKLKKQLDAYKAKAAKGPLTNEEYRDFKLLMQKAQVYYSGDEKYKFLNTAINDVLKKQIDYDAAESVKSFNKNVGEVQEKLVNSKSAEELATHKDEIAKVKDEYFTKGKQLHDLKGSLLTVMSSSNSSQNIKTGKGDNPGTHAEDLDKILDESLPKLFSDYETASHLFQGTDAVKNAVTDQKRNAGDIANAAVTGIGGDPNLTQTQGGNTNSGYSSSVGYSYRGGATSGNKPAADPLDMKFNNDGSVTYTGRNNPIDSAGLKKQIDADSALLSQLKNTNYQSAPGSDYQPKADVGGYLMDIGRAGLGLKGAMGNVPEYNPSQMFTTAMNESEQRRNMGLSAQETSEARHMAERGYGYDVKNIANLSGGSAGVALGNLGRANTQLQDQYGNIASADQQARRMNRNQFYNAANQVENVNQYKFGVDYQNAMMNKQAGSALVNDALSNIRNRRQYDNTYGKGSQYAGYMDELIKGKNQENQYLENGNERRRMESIAGLQTTLDANNKKLAGMTGSYTNTGDVPAGQYKPGAGLTGQAGLGALNAEQLAKEGITKETNVGKTGPIKGVLSEVYSSQVQPPVNDPAAIKEMENSGANVYQQVLNTPEFQTKIQGLKDSYASQIEALKTKENNSKSVLESKIHETNRKKLEEKLAKEIDGMTKEQEKWADSQFDENGKYIVK